MTMWVKSCQLKIQDQLDNHCLICIKYILKVKKFAKAALQNCKIKKIEEEHKSWQHI